MKNSIMDIIQDILCIDRQALETGLDSSDIWDSLKRVEIIFAIEDELDVTFTDDDLAQINTPGKLIEIVEGKNEA